MVGCLHLLGARPVLPRDALGAYHPVEDALEVVPQTCFLVEVARSAFEVSDLNLEVDVGLGGEEEARG